MLIHELHQIFLKHPIVSTDTRNIIPNSIFFALKGEHFDANSFAAEALQKEAAYVVIDALEFHKPENKRYILVENVLETLQKLAQFHRRYLNIPIVGLTGSNGKTTTKELMLAVLSQKYTTKATKGNLNNHIGVPLTLLSFDTSTEIGIVEMGANHQKEIEFLCTLAQPNLGYITNFGKAHLEGFGGVEGIIKGKSELYNYLIENNQKVLVNLDDEIQIEKTKNAHKFTFSFHNPTADVLFSDVTINPMVSLFTSNQPIQSNLIGDYNALNIAAAISLGFYFKIGIEAIKKGIENYIPTNNRSQIIKKNTTTIILDAYNANPSSMKAALDNFLLLENPKKQVILGDMFELGEFSSEEHQKIVDFLTNQPSIQSVLIGKYFYEAKNEASNCRFYENLDSFKPTFTSIFTDGLLLIKGSRGMALEKIIDWF